MSERIARSGSANADGLDVHLVGFLATLAKAGYAETTQHEKRRGISLFIRWVRNTRRTVADLDEVRIGAFLARRSCRRRFKDRASARAALHQFLEHLRIVGVVPPPRSEHSPAEVLVRRYLDHLRDDRGLCPRSIEVYSPFVRAFVVAQRLPEALLALDAGAVRNYLLDHSQSRSVSFVKLLTATLRSFLRWYRPAYATPSSAPFDAVMWTSVSGHTFGAPARGARHAVLRYGAMLL